MPGARRPRPLPEQRADDRPPPGDFEPVADGYCDGSTVHTGADARRCTAASSARSTSRPRGPLPRRHRLHRRRAPGRRRRPPTGARSSPRTASRSRSSVTTTTGPDRAHRRGPARDAYLHRDAGPARRLPDGDQPRRDRLGRADRRRRVLARARRPRRRQPQRAGLRQLRRLRPRLRARRHRARRLAGARRPPGLRRRPHRRPGLRDGEVDDDVGGAILASVAVGDPDRDGVPEVFAADFEGKVYGWDAGRDQRLRPRSRTRPTRASRWRRSRTSATGKRNRTQHGFFGSPVLADIDGDGTEEIVAAAMDRHVYAWERRPDPTAGRRRRGPAIPLLVVDPAKVAVDRRRDARRSPSAQTPAPSSRARSSTRRRRPRATSTPARRAARDRRRHQRGVRRAARTAASTPTGLSVGLLASQSSASSARATPASTRSSPTATPTPTRSRATRSCPGWPIDVGIALTELLPVVGEGVTGSPVDRPGRLPERRRAAPRSARSPAPAPPTSSTRTATSCYGAGPRGNATSRSQADFAASARQVDHPVLAGGRPPGVRRPRRRRPTPSFLTPAAGVIRALDLALHEYQGGQDFVGGLDTATGQFQPGLPGAVNDLQFLTGPSVADIDGAARRGDRSRARPAVDLAAFNAAGAPVRGWPKLSTDWTVANPLIGIVRHASTPTAAPARSSIGMTRSGYINAYETDAPAPARPSSWPRFHHDNANSGDYSRDAVLPGALDASRRTPTAERSPSRAPGDDLLCGTADHYEVVDLEPRDRRGRASAMRRRSTGAAGPAERRATSRRSTFPPAPSATSPSGRSTSRATSAGARSRSASSRPGRARSIPGGRSIAGPKA